MKRRSAYLFSIAALAAATTTLRAAEPTLDELKAQIQSLQKRVDELDNQKITTAQVDATVERVLRDANHRSQLLAVDGGFLAGYDKGFFIKSEDNNFVLRPGLLFQFRNITTNRNGNNDDTQNGFEIRRLRPRLDGNFLTPDLTYSFVLDTNRSGGSVALLDAWAQYRFAPQWAIKFGQFRESWVHEGDVSDSQQLTVERSLVDGLLAGSLVDRVQGVSLIYGGTKDDSLRAEATFHDGANSKNTDFRDAQPGATSSDPPTFVSNFGFGGRVEYKVFGDWANYKDYTAKGNKDDLLVLGAGADWTQVGDRDTYRTDIDAQWENTTGVNVYGELNGVITNQPSAGDDQRIDWGGLVQAGYLFAPNWEVFGRYDLVKLDSDFVTGNDTFNEFTVGLNYFLGDKGVYLHRAKITGDVVYLPDGSPANVTGTGVLAADDSELLFRLQFQLSI